MERLDRKIRTVWITISAITSSFIGLLIAVPVHLVLGSPALTAIAFIIIPFISVNYSRYRYKNWLFKVHEDHLEINHGVITKTSMAIPYVRVQHIDTNQGPIERFLGLASLRVYTAGSRGADMRIPGLKKERAEEMQEELKAKAIESEHGFDGV